jgi:hypothetical protein
MEFYKILGDENGMRYKRGLNINSEPLDPKGTIVEEGGFLFSRENIFAMLGRGPYIRQVKLTPFSNLKEDLEGMFRADEIILGKRRHLDLVRIKSLISEGADVSVKNGRVLFWACDTGHYDIVKYLLGNGMIPEQRCLYHACATGHYKVVRELVENGIKSDEMALRLADANKFDRIVRLLRRSK